MPFGLQPTHLLILLITCLSCAVPIVIIGGVVYLIVSRSSKNAKSSEIFSSLDILKARYAKGELTREQFEQMKRDLEN